jgi:hypothetical protein
MAGREVGPQFDDDVAAGRKGEGQVVGVGHDGLPNETVEGTAI